MYCPLCNNSSHQLFQKEGYCIRECTNCSHRFTEIQMDADHAETVYEDSYFFDGGAGYDNYLDEAELLIEHGERYAKILAEYTSPGTVLDVGAAAGFILKGLENGGWRGDGIEPNARMAQYARDELGLHVQAGALEDFEPGQSYDLVTVIQVVAHFYDIHKAFQVIADALKPEGLLLIETWNRESFPARMLGSNWHAYSPPSVVHWFSLGGLSDFLQKYGFEEVAHGRPEKWLKGKHAKSVLKYNVKGNPFSRTALSLVKLLPDHIKIPYPALDLFWVLYVKV